MKSKIVCMTVAGLMGLAASADVLYWQVGADSSGYDYDTAYLMARDSENNLYYVGTSYGEDGRTVVSNDGAVDAGQFANGGYALGDLSTVMSWDESASSGTAASGWNFYVELWNETSGWVGRTTDMSYDALVSSGAIRGDSITSDFSLNNAVGHSASGFTHEVPEPTSGLLMLVGLGALALRRRRA